MLFQAKHAQGWKQDLTLSEVTLKQPVTLQWQQDHFTPCVTLRARILEYPKWSLFPIQNRTPQGFAQLNR